MACLIDVAVFPLANAILFPGVALPLHVFEGRYERMVADVRARGWSLAISWVEPGDVADEYVLNSVCGAGKVQVYQEYSSGASDIWVHGEQRVRLQRFIQKDPYLIMEAEVLQPDRNETDTDALTKVALAEFQLLAKSWAFMNPDLPHPVPEVFQEFKDLGTLCDFFVFHFLKKLDDKQGYLSITNPIERADRLSAFLEKDLMRLSRKADRIKRTSWVH